MQTKSTAITERCRYLLTKPGMVDHDIAKARTGQATEQPLDERPPADLEQGFGAFVRQRPHALAAAGGEDHRLHERSASARAWAAASCGVTCCCNHVPSGASSA